jgi:hypothetical protein
LSQFILCIFYSSNNPYLKLKAKSLKLKVNVNLRCRKNVAIFVAIPIIKALAIKFVAVIANLPLAEPAAKRIFYQKPFRNV